MEQILFNTTERYTAEDIRKVQDVLLVMAQKVHEVLDRHGVHYFIAFGTLLGAVRHQGFIPWDDDFDMFLIEEEYEDALKYLRAELPAWMIVHDAQTDPIYWPYWSRIRDKNSEAVADLYPDDNHYKYRGINLDMYKLKKRPTEENTLFRLEEKVSFYDRKHAAGLIPDDRYVSLSEQTRQEIADEQVRLQSVPRSGKQEYMYVDLIYRIAPEEIFPLKKYRFADREFRGPADADAILKRTYGDYMKLPPVEKRQPHYSAVRYFDEHFIYQ